MGTAHGDRAVVNPRLRGMDSLRIMDCSAMPTQVSVNTKAPVMAMAVKGRRADL